MSSGEPEWQRIVGDLAPDEAVYVSSQLTAMFGELATKFPLESMLRHWQRLVTSLEKPYAMSIYDYDRAVYDRECIEEVTAGAPPGLRQRLEAAIRPLDAQYKRLTVEVSSPLLPGYHHWWWFRIPAANGERMRSDLRERGF